MTTATLDGLVSAGLVHEYEIEKKYVDEDLDFEYVLDTAMAMANALVQGKVAEAAYQPGDGTFYGLVIIPLSGAVPAPPRVKNGTEWERLAVRGVSHRQEDGQFVYDENAYLVVWVEHAAYPFRLGQREDLAFDYVGEKLTDSKVSAVSLAILLRAISSSLDAMRAI